MADVSITRRARRLAVTHVPVGNVTTPVARPLPRRLLGVWAHPDDECYLSAGLMARVVAAGGHVRVVCATRGELGSPDPGATAHVAALRHRELQSSLAVLGVHDLHVLGLPDGGCADVDPARMVRVVADHVADIGADVVVTFGADGITGHADHLAVSRWATAAAADTSEVLHATMTDRFVARHRELHDRLGLFVDRPDGRPCSVPRNRVALQVSLDHAELIRKRRALAEHASQTEPLAALVGEDTYFSWWRDECFRRPTENEVAAARVAELEGAGVGVGA